MTPSAPDSEPRGWLETVTLEGSTEPVRVQFDGRDGHKLYVRQVDPCDELPDRVPIYDGDELIVMMALSHASVNTAESPGPGDEMVLAKRIVPVRREPGRVFVRTLKHGEADNGERVHVRPGDDVTIDAGAFSIDISALDSHEEAFYESGAYVPLTPVLNSWFGIGTHHEEKARYLTAAARRLDASQSLFDRVKELQSSIEDERHSAGQRRRHALDLIRTVEVAIVTLGRVSHMIQKAQKLANIDASIPGDLTRTHATLKEIRDAYEHIEERAVGKSFGKVDPAAHQIFDYEELILHGKVSYNSRSLDLDSDVANFIEKARRFLRDAAGDA